MKWVTREHVKVGRIACAWAIARFIDPDAEFEYLPREAVLPTAEREGATPFHIRGAEIAHRGRQTSFEVLVERYDLGGDPALVLLARIVNGADTDNSTFNQPEGPGLRAITDGLGALGVPDVEVVRRGSMVFDALYAYCQGKAPKP
jgi:hypothetical protein